MLRVGFAWLLSAMLVSGCASDVATDYDSSVDFSGFSTYQYHEDPNTPVTLDGARIKKAVDKEMALRGMRLSESDGQLTVYYEILEASELLADGPTFSFGFGTGSINSDMALGLVHQLESKRKNTAS